MFYKAVNFHHCVDFTDLLKQFIYISFLSKLVEKMNLTKINSLQSGYLQKLSHSKKIQWKCNRENFQIFGLSKMIFTN